MNNRKTVFVDQNDGLYPFIQKVPIGNRAGNFAQPTQMPDTRFNMAPNTPFGNNSNSGFTEAPRNTNPFDWPEAECYPPKNAPRESQGGGYADQNQMMLNQRVNRAEYVSPVRNGKFFCFDAKVWRCSFAKIESAEQEYEHSALTIRWHTQCTER